jgi:hypothetical protein
MDFLVQNKYAIGGAMIILSLFFPQLKTLLSKIKLPSLPSLSGLSKVVEVEVDVEEADQAAMRHLRKRAVECGDKDLVNVIKSVDGKFYDLHVGAKNANS